MAMGAFDRLKGRGRATSGTTARGLLGNEGYALAMRAASRMVSAAGMGGLRELAEEARIPKEDVDATLMRILADPDSPERLKLLSWADFEDAMAEEGFRPLVFVAPSETWKTVGKRFSLDRDTGLPVGVPAPHPVHHAFRIRAVPKSAGVEGIAAEMAEFERQDGGKPRHRLLSSGSGLLEPAWRTLVWGHLEGKDPAMTIQALRREGEQPTLCLRQGDWIQVADPDGIRLSELVELADLRGVSVPERVRELAADGRLADRVLPEEPAIAGQVACLLRDTVLPDCFRDVAMHAEWSSSAFVPGREPGLLNMHVYAALDRPVDLDRMRKAVQAHVDRATTVDGRMLMAKDGTSRVEANVYNFKALYFQGAVFDADAARFDPFRGKSRRFEVPGLRPEAAIDETIQREMERHEASRSVSDLAMGEAGPLKQRMRQPDGGASVGKAMAALAGSGGDTHRQVGSATFAWAVEKGWFTKAELGEFVSRVKGERHPGRDPSHFRDEEVASSVETAVLKLGGGLVDSPARFAEAMSDPNLHYARKAAMAESYGRTACVDHGKGVVKDGAGNAVLFAFGRAVAAVAEGKVVPLVHGGSHAPGCGQAASDLLEHAKAVWAKEGEGWPVPGLDGMSVGEEAPEPGWRRIGIRSRDGSFSPIGKVEAPEPDREPKPRLGFMAFSFRPPEPAPKPVARAASRGFGFPQRGVGREI